MKRRLALACTRGWRQESVVNELLAGPVQMHRDMWDHVTLGDTKIEYRSFTALKRRLVIVGFVFKKLDRERWLMRFPEEEEK